MCSSAAWHTANRCRGGNLRQNHAMRVSWRAAADARSARFAPFVLERLGNGRGHRRSAGAQGPALCFPAISAFTRGRFLTGETHASIPLFPAHPARAAARGRNRLAPANAARRHDAAGGGRHLCLPAARLPRLAENLPNRARGAGPLRRHRTVDADHPVRRPVARKRTLRRLRQGDAAHQGPPRARHALRSDQRGDDHRDFPRLCALVQGPAAQSLSHPVEIPRRGAPAFRRHARPRIPDEGCLFVRRRSGRRPAQLQQDVRRLSAHLRAVGVEVDPDARGVGTDRRQSVARIHHPRLHRRVRKFSATRTISICRCRRRT